MKTVLIRERYYLCQEPDKRVNLISLCQDLLDDVIKSRQIEALLEVIATLEVHVTKEEYQTSEEFYFPMPCPEEEHHQSQEHQWTLMHKIPSRFQTPNHRK